MSAIGDTKPNVRLDGNGYPQCLRELYQSEFLGERIFLGLLENASDQQEKYKFGTLLQLETETKARLRPILAKYDLPFSEPDMSVQVQTAVDDFKVHGWSGFVDSFLNVVRYFVGRFREIELLGPREDWDVLHSMVVHEQAIQQFLEAEHDGRPKNSLAAVIAQLNYPLPNPRAY